jgi:formyl-CoA transferase
VPFAPVNTPADVFEDPQVSHLNTFCESEHPTEGRVVNIRSPILLDGRRADIAAPPTLGENTDEVLRGLGYAAGEIADLHADGVV